MTTLSEKEITVLVIALLRHASVHPRMMEALLRHFGNVERIIKTDAGTLMAVSGMSAEEANEIAAASDYLSDAEIYYQSLSEKEIQIHSRFDKLYPERLFELNDPPSLIYYRGKLPAAGQKLAAIVGSSNATATGIELTTTVAKILVDRKVEIVSGINSGIAVAAHLGAKAAGGISYAVLESGHENIHQQEHRPLAIDIVKEGGIISEFSPEIEADIENFTDANRLIVALSQAVIITEMYEDDVVMNDLLKCCSQIGKMAFILIDPKHGGLTDEKTLRKAVTYGAIPMVGLEKLDDIIISLV